MNKEHEERNTWNFVIWIQNTSVPPLKKNIPLTQGIETMATHQRTNGIDRTAFVYKAKNTFIYIIVFITQKPLSFIKFTMFPNLKNKSLSQRITKMTKEKSPNDTFLDQMFGHENSRKN